MSVNALSRPLVARLMDDRVRLRIKSSTTPEGTCIVDAGIGVPGSIEAGLAVATICTAGLATFRLRADSSVSGWPTWIDVQSSQPVLACLGSQYAGWSLSASKEETGARKFFALGSGPARALYAREEIFKEIGYSDVSDTGCLVMEVDRPPPPVVLQKVLRECSLQPSGLTVILTPTSSAAGTTQVVARVLEVALHKAHVLGFPLSAILAGSATAPLPPAAVDPAEAMGRTNDAILYGGQVHLTVDGSDDDVRDLAKRLPSLNSRDYGRPFAQVFRDYDFDFYKVDSELFAPAEVWVSSRASGTTWHAGRSNLGMLTRQWMQEAA
ncbi:MAG TPA: methenyltetrahydromethanopterin cyclohydrolase [Lautropia sp.]|nr:methenyltetrahydromethanopterin cyclohydrolase [Lautropia sp.]